MIALALVFLVRYMYTLIKIKNTVPSINMLTSMALYFRSRLFHVDLTGGISAKITNTVLKIFFIKKDDYMTFTMICDNIRRLHAHIGVCLIVNVVWIIHTIFLKTNVSKYVDVKVQKFRNDNPQNILIFFSYYCQFS